MEWKNAGDPFTLEDGLMDHINSRRQLYAKHMGVNVVELLYLYMGEEAAHRCVEDLSFANLSRSGWSPQIRDPTYGPIGPYDWFVAVPSEWYQAAAAAGSLLVVNHFAVVAWGRVTRV